MPSKVMGPAAMGTPLAKGSMVTSGMLTLPSAHCAASRRTWTEVPPMATSRSMRLPKILPSMPGSSAPTCPSTRGSGAPPS